MAEAVAEGVLLEREGELGGPRFDPPLYRQRYQFVLSACKRLQPARVVDMGCAECKLVKLLRRKESVRELVGVDIQASLLESQQRNLQPLISDFILPRSSPLTIHLMQGSIVEADQRLTDFDLMTCIEVVEHLDPPVLERLPATVFGEMQPRVAIVTTPNSEFNVLFPDLHGFRHPDHRFEWTRSQFREWCEGVCKEFPQYSVEYSGVGYSRRDVGPCSQIATFTRQGEFSSKECVGCPYRTVMECEYPYREPLPVTERLRQEVEYRLLQLMRWREEEEGEIRVELQSLLQYKHISQLCSGVEEIREALKDSAVVKRIEGDMVVLDTHQWDSDSSSSQEEGEKEGAPVDLGPEETENWD